MEINPLVGMSTEDRLDAFLLDTFQTHTRHDRTMVYKDIYECYLQWCEAMDIPPVGSQIQIGAALRRRYFFLNRGNYKHWFIEIKEDLMSEELENEFGTGDPEPAGDGSTSG